MIQYAFILLLIFTPVQDQNACTPTSCERIPVSLTANVPSTRDPSYTCRGENVTFDCEVIGGASLQWVSGSDIPCDNPISYGSGDDEGEIRTRGSYQSRLVSVARSPPNSNFTSNLTFTPSPTVNSVTVVCGDQLLSCCSSEDKSTIIITDAPRVFDGMLQHSFINQETCPYVSVVLQLEEIEGIGLNYELTVSSSDGCALQECPMLLSPGERILENALLNGVDYIATLVVSNDCGSDSTTVLLQPSLSSCEVGPTDPPKTPENSGTIAASAVGLVTVAVAAVLLLLGGIALAAIICNMRKKLLQQKNEHEQATQAMMTIHAKEVQKLKERAKRRHGRKVKRTHDRSSIALQDVPESSLSLSGSMASGATLHMAVKQGELAEVKRLVDEGAGINIKDNNEMTPLHVAVERALTEIVKFLVDRGADITIKDYNGMTPLHVAAERGRREEILKYLIAKGGDTSINIQDEDGRTPLHVAVREGQECTVKFLVESEADLTVKDGRGMTPFHAAAERGRCEEILGCLIAKAGDSSINIKDDDERTPLHVAVEEGQECTVESLVEKYQADINNKDIDGMTPLHVAVERGDRINIMKYLIKKGADINIKDNHERTPIHIAAREGHEYSVRTLVMKRADITIRDKDGMTPQEVADESGHVNITKFLQKERIPEDTEEFPRNISMMDISVLAVGNEGMEGGRHHSNDGV